jgi:hypothetical protein
MATKILVGLVVALLGTGLGVYVAFVDTTPCPHSCPSVAQTASEGGCCSGPKSCCEAESEAACCHEATACQPSEALAACAGGATIGNAPRSKAVAHSASAQ